MKWIKTAIRLPELKYKYEMKNGIELVSDPVLCVTKKSKSILILYYSKIEADYTTPMIGWFFKNGKPLHEKAEVVLWMELPKIPEVF